MISTILSETIPDELDNARHVRSMKRAPHVVFRDDYNSLNKGNYKIDCTAWGGGVSIYIIETI